MDRLCFTQEQDALLARGWPRLVRLVDDHPDDKRAARSVLAWLGAWKRSKYFGEWPREVAYRALRFGPRLKMKSGTVWQTKLVAADLAMAEMSGAPKSSEVKEALMRAASSFDFATFEEKIHAWIFIAETLVGADATLDALAEGFEHARARQTQYDLHFKCAAVRAAGFLFLRAKKKSYADRFGALLDRFRLSAKKKDAWVACAENLDAVLNGTSGVKRLLGSRRSTIYAEYAADDPAYVLECLAANPDAETTVRVVALAGTAAMNGITKRRWESAKLPFVARDFGMIKTEETVALMVSLAGRTSVKDQPLRWFREHADFAKPILRTYAKRGNADASRILRVIGSQA